MQKRKLADWLDDLCVRFVINNPIEELESMERICFQIEEAQWFYEDFLRPLDSSLPSLKLRDFYLKISKRCPLLADFSEEQHAAAFETFLAYKTRVPVRGAILLNKAMDHVLMVRGFQKSQSWSFPRGKINKDEGDLDCAIREVLEETGYDAREEGVVPSDEKHVKFFEVTLREQNVRLCVLRGVDTSFNFEPKTRKEIGKIEWIRLEDLPTFDKTKSHQIVHAGADKKKYYMVVPFVKPLKKWIESQRRLDIDLARQKLSEQSRGQMPQIASPPIDLEEGSQKLLAQLRGTHIEQPPGRIENTIHPQDQAAIDQAATDRVKSLLWSGPALNSREIPPPVPPPMHLQFEMPPFLMQPHYIPPPHIPTPHLALASQFQPPPPPPPPIPHTLPLSELHNIHSLAPPPPPASIAVEAPNMPRPPQRFNPEKPKTAHQHALLSLFRGDSSTNAPPPPPSAPKETASILSLVQSLGASAPPAPTAPPAPKETAAPSKWDVSAEQQQKLLQTLKMLIPPGGRT